jgi:acyl-CoA-binding protein
MSIEEDFRAAQTRVKQLSKTPAPAQLLELYALYKQASVGDAEGKRPGALDFKGRAKFDAWTARRGTSKVDAMTAYVALVTRLVGELG